jgi:hypothetical protein
MEDGGVYGGKVSCMVINLSAYTVMDGVEQKLIKRGVQGVRG